MARGNRGRSYDMTTGQTDAQLRLATISRDERFQSAMARAGHKRTGMIHKPGTERPVLVKLGRDPTGGLARGREWP
jgi:hypothetical protein